MICRKRPPIERTNKRGAGPMSDDYVLRQILSELQKQTKLLKEISGNVSGVEQAVYDTAPSS